MKNIKLFITTIILSILTLLSSAVTLEWCPNDDGIAVGYFVYYGTGNITNWQPRIVIYPDTNNLCDSIPTIISNGTNWLRNYPMKIDAKTNTTLVITNLIPYTTYYFAATAYSSDGLESDFSDEISYTVLPSKLTNSPSELKIVVF